MNILEQIKRIPFILGILSVVLIIGIVFAADYYQVNSGAQVTINEWSVCKKVTNNNALAIFVPTKTAAEWTAFRTNASGVTYAECCSANGVACSSDGNCCSAICGTNADGDAYFSSAAGHTGICQATSKPYTDCCDTDNRAYLGETTYYSTINNCGSWDYDCSGGISKSSSCQNIGVNYCECRYVYPNSSCTGSILGCACCEYVYGTWVSCGDTSQRDTCSWQTMYDNPAGTCNAHSYYHPGYNAPTCTCK